MRDFDDTAAVSSYIAPRPAQYALCCLEEFEYIELWYLMPEGCADTVQHQLTQYDDAFGLTGLDDMVALKSVSSLKASKNIVPDGELSFRQKSMLKLVCKRYDLSEMISKCSVYKDKGRCSTTD